MIGRFHAVCSRSSPRKSQGLRKYQGKWSTNNSDARGLHKSNGVTIEHWKILLYVDSWGGLRAAWTQYKLYVRRFKGEPCLIP